jgi:hypothetical protein
MDEALEFALPTVDERRKILDLYLDRWASGSWQQKEPGWCMGVERAGLVHGSGKSRAGAWEWEEAGLVHAGAWPSSRSRPSAFLACPPAFLGPSLAPALRTHELLPLTPVPPSHARTLSLRYISKSGTHDNAAGAESQGISGRVNALLRGRKMEAEKIAIKGIDEAKLQQAAKATEGFSGRELAKFMAAVQAAVYGQAKAELTPEIWDTVLQRKLFEHQERRAFKLGHHGTYEPSPAGGPATPPKTK